MGCHADHRTERDDELRVAPHGDRRDRVGERAPSKMRFDAGQRDEFVVVVDRQRASVVLGPRERTIAVVVEAYDRPFLGEIEEDLRVDAGDLDWRAAVVEMADRVGCGAGDIEQAA